MKPFLLIGCLFAPLAALAQSTFTFTPSSMGPIIPGNWPSSTNSQSFVFPSPTASLANYNSLQVTFSAPSGYAWEVVPGLAGWAFGCSASYALLGDPEDFHQTGSYSFTFVPGMASSVSGAVINQRLSEQSFGFDAAFPFDRTAEFTSLTVTMNYVPLHAWQVAQRPLAQFDHSSMMITYAGIPDSNPHLFLVPTPEPSVTALAILGAAVMVGGLGRRFRCRPEV